MKNVIGRRVLISERQKISPKTKYKLGDKGLPWEKGARIHEYRGKQELFLRQKPVELNRLIGIAKIQSTEASNRIEAT